jgi:GNAT superfamily N-acetyltransferase
MSLSSVPMDVPHAGIRWSCHFSSWDTDGMAASRDKLVVTPLTARLWPTFVDLLDEGGPASRCWCMAPRIGASYRRQSPGQNRDAFQDIVEEGPPPGLLALEGKTAVGWCQLTSREVVPAVERSWRTRRVDELPVWLISCFYVRKGHRRQGITALLIQAAVDRARSAGVSAIEAYPLDGEVSPSATSTGYASTFAAAGFREVARRSPERPIMRLGLA